MEIIKKTIPSVILLILLSVNCNSQWYKRQYGANDIFQLTPEQFKEAYRKADVGTWSGAMISVLGVAGTITGISLASSAGSMGSEGEGRAFTGVFLTIGSVPLALTGFTLWGIYGSRRNKIKEILKNAELNIGFINYCQDNLLKYSNKSPSAGISINVRF